jgi:hypothetical protein
MNILFSFDTPGDYKPHIKYPDAENYLIKKNEMRREYPLVLILHSFIDEMPTEFFQLVNE